MYIGGHIGSKVIIDEVNCSASSLLYYCTMYCDLI